MSKLNAFASNKLKLSQIKGFVKVRTETLCEKGGNARDRRLILFPYSVSRYLDVYKCRFVYSNMLKSPNTGTWTIALSILKYI